MKATIKQMVTVTAVAALLTGVMASGAFAFTAADVARFKAKSCSKPCDLTKADLKALTITTGVADGADLTGATLNGSNFSSTAFTAAKLNGADLSGANLSSCKFSGANLTGAIISATTDFTGASFSYAKWIDGTTLPNGAVGNKNLKPTVPVK